MSSWLPARNTTKLKHNDGHICRESVAVYDRGLVWKGDVWGHCSSVIIQPCTIEVGVAGRSGEWLYSGEGKLHSLMYITQRSLNSYGAPVCLGDMWSIV